MQLVNEKGLLLAFIENKGCAHLRCTTECIFNKGECMPLRHVCYDCPNDKNRYLRQDDPYYCKKLGDCLARIKGRDVYIVEYALKIITKKYPELLGKAYALLLTDKTFTD